MTKLDGKSKDIVSENIQNLKELFPEVFSEGKIDFTKLQEELGEFTDKENERYNFTWNGKQEAKRIAQTPSTGTLRPCKVESKNWNTTQNLYIEGDNLEVLKLLQKSYHKKVKMIYIDPPYNTGKDFVYKDNFRDNIKNYMEQTGQIDSDGNRLSTNSDTNGRYHSDWLSMMYPRLKLARNLLKDDGIIFISIGQDELNTLISICNEIFGESNKVSIVGRLAKSGGNKGKFFSPNIEYLLVYAKNIEKANGFRDEMDSELIKKVYTKIHKGGDRDGEKYRAMGLYQSSLDSRANQRYFIKTPDGSLIIPPGAEFPLVKEEGSKIKPISKKDGVWRWTYPKYLEELSKGNVEFSKTKSKILIDENGSFSEWTVNSKIWLKERQEEGQLPNDLISKFENRHSAKELKELDIEFDFPKPSDLIKYLCTISSVKNTDIVLDFFSGSATTAHAVMKANSNDDGHRKYICVQLPEKTNDEGFINICEIGKERIRRAGDKVIADNLDKNLSTLDIGFKVYKLDSSNIKEWDSDFDNLEANLLDAVDNIKEDRTSEDLLYEILLKYGLDLTLPIKELTIEGKTVYNIGFGALVVCLDDNITIEVVEAIGEFIKEQVVYDEEKKKRHARVVFKDKSFVDTNVKTNAIQILKQFDIDDVVSI
ncbi:MAG: site-specific DNA-methyltransferase [Arcobacter sp.]|nr:MAG: site-specific DNA-methyltransferase [Arcobacter sp.]